MPAEPIKRAYYSIGEVAELLNVNTSLLRFWETKFDGLTPKKTRGGTRMYSLKELEQLKVIHFLVKDKGYTLKGAQERMRSDAGAAEKELRIVSTLQKVRAFLVELKEEL